MIYKAIVEELIPNVWVCACEIQGQYLHTSVYMNNKKAALSIIRSRLAAQKYTLLQAKKIVWKNRVDKIEIEIRNEEKSVVELPASNKKPEKALYRIVKTESNGRTIFGYTKERIPLMTWSEMISTLKKLSDEND